MKYSVFIFDFDGTLCDTNLAVEFCIMKSLEDFKFNYEKNYINKLISQGLNLQDTFSKLVPDNYIIRLVEKYRVIYNDGKGIEMSDLYSGVIDVFKFLKENNATILIVSNKGIKSVLDAVKFFKLEEYISYCIADMPGVKKKPDPMIYNEIIRNKYPKINNENVLMVGDTEADIMFARNSFITSCWAKYGYGNIENCRKLNPNFHLNSFKSLLEIV